MIDLRKMNSLSLFIIVLLFCGTHSIFSSMSETSFLFSMALFILKHSSRTPTFPGSNGLSWITVFFICSYREGSQLHIRHFKVSLIHQREKQKPVSHWFPLFPFCLLVPGKWSQWLEIQQPCCTKKWSCRWKLFMVHKGKHGLAWPRLP